jgi:hypothetical protein
MHPVANPTTHTINTVDTSVGFFIGVTTVLAAAPPQAKPARRRPCHRGPPPILSAA